MKINESPSIILAFHGMLGRKKQTGLLLLLLTLVFSFLTAAVIYSVSSAQALQDTRCVGVLPYSSSTAIQSMERIVPSLNWASSRLVSML